jgi:tricorn protease-like protein
MAKYSTSEMKARTIASVVFLLMILIGAVTQQSFSQTIVRHQQPVQAVTFSWDGRKLVSGSSGGAIKVWDASSQKVERVIWNWQLDEEQHPWFCDWVSGLAVSLDGNSILVAGNTGTFKVYSTKTGQLQRDLPNQAWERNLYFSPRGNRVADHDGQLWELNMKRGLRKIGRINGEIDALNISINGRTLITGTHRRQKLDGRKIRFWDVGKLQLVHTVQLSWAPSANYQLALSPDGGILAVAGYNDIHLFDARSGKPIKTLKGHRGAVNCLAFSPDGKNLVSGGDDSKVKIWHIK